MTRTRFRFLLAGIAFVVLSVWLATPHSNGCYLNDLASCRSPGLPSSGTYPGGHGAEIFGVDNYAGVIVLRGRS